MSFILDALKKSETERQRQSIPGLVDAGPARPRPRLPRWALALGILLAVNLLALVFMLTRGLISPAHEPALLAVIEPRHRGTDAVRSTVPGVDLAATSADAHESPLATPPVYAPEISAAELPPRVATPAAGGALAKSASTGSSGLRSVRRRDPLLTDGDYKANDEEVLPTISEINFSGSQSLPELHLDVHVFATKPAERFVYVNMRKYHEGAALQEGPVVERIRRDGVILNFQGVRFLLPRQ